MSEANFHVKQAHFETKSFIAPCRIIFHRSLSDAAIRLILAFQAIDTCTKNWVIRQCDIQKRLGWGVEKMRNTIKECIKYGYMQVRQSRESAGKFSRNDFNFDINASYLDTVETAPTDTFQPSTGFPSTVEPCTEKQPLPMTKTVTNFVDKQGNDCKQLGGEEALPFTEEESKFPLKENQKEIFRELKTLGLECDDYVLNILVRSHNEKVLSDSIQHLRHEISKGTRFKKSRVAFFRACLSGKISPVTKKADWNRKFAENTKAGKNWTSLEIHEKYMKCSKCHKEVPFNVSKEDFTQMLKDLYALSKLH